MHFTPADHLGAVDRSLSTITRDGEELRLLTVTRRYDATADDVWDALTTRDRIARWMMPVTGDLEPGGRYQLEGNAGGEILTCDRPERLSLTWVYGDQVSWVDVSLRPTDGGTLLQLDHAVPVDDHYAQFGPGATGIGWELSLMGLAEHLAEPAVVPREQAPTPELADFMRASSTAWGQASIAAGTDPDEARAAAERCAAAYTAG
jgi:uncharacterized protein YndB with AHSA1/START domain